MHRTEKKKKRKAIKNKNKNKKQKTDSPIQKCQAPQALHVSCVCEASVRVCREAHEGGVAIMVYRWQWEQMWWCDLVAGVEGGVCQDLQQHGHFEFWV